MSAPRGYAPPSSPLAASPLSASVHGPITSSVQPGRSPAPSLRSVPSNGSLRSPEDPFVNPIPPLAPSLSDQFSLSPDPSRWGAHLSPDHKEPDDYLHNPDPKRDRNIDSGGTLCTARGITNLGFMFFLCVGLIMLFAGYPIISVLTQKKIETMGGYNLGGINATGQVPLMPGNFGLIDKDTPAEAHHKISYRDGTEWDLVFSDEFNLEGRSFYPGDDPYWEAVDLHYWGTNNLEWYEPDAVTTEGGSLKITLAEKPTHNLQYSGGLISTWNKFCFTGGLIETSVSLPGRSDVYGLWPAVWTMGNLGRAGYGASLDGTWPYSYDSCDVGTLANQTLNGRPLAALTQGDPGNNNELSFLPGQRLSACTCAGEAHPGPIKPDGTYKGRAAPEIDIIEAQVDATSLIGHVSQSCQWAPFNANYEWFNETNLIIDDPQVSLLNPYKGGVYQQASSVVSITDQQCYTEMSRCYSVYGFEYKPGFDGYITWINDNKSAWTLLAPGMAADPRVEIGPRPVPEEPLYIIANLGISRNFGPLDEENLRFPSVMLVDYIRVYQPKDAYNVGCDPPDFPTADYINTFIEAYTNPNLTTWVDDYKQTIPRNRLIDQC